MREKDPEEIEGYNVTEGLIEDGQQIEPEAEFLPNYRWEKRDIDKFEVDVGDELPKPKFLLSSKDVPFAMLGGFMCITGQAGNGKTNLLSLLAATILKGQIGHLKYELSDEMPQPSIVYIDTEQERYYTQLFAKKVFALVGWNLGENVDRLKVYNFREETDNEDKWKDIIKAIDQNKPTVAIIDGLLDAVNNQNDLEKCVPLINACLAIASHYPIALWGVIHQNPKNKNDMGKMSGNLGSIASRKASDVVCCEKNKETKVFTFKHDKSRGKDVPEWNFTIDDSMYKFGIPKLSDNAQSIQTTKQPPTPEERRKQLEDKYGTLGIGQDGVTATELTKRLNCKKGLNKGKTADLQEAIKLGVMSYNDINRRYYFHRQPQPIQTEMDLSESATMEQTPTAEPLPTETDRSTQIEQLTGDNDDTKPFPAPDGKDVPF